MKIFISPAKSLDLKSDIPTIEESQPLFLNEAKSLNNLLRKKTISNLVDLMKISEKLGQLNWERNQNFKPPFTSENSRPAIFMFNGDVYSGLDSKSFSNKSLKILQKNVRIISGLYGLLRPFDLIQPYRLEMGTFLKNGSNNNLYEFWKKKITNYIIQETDSDEILVDLASKEYSSAIDFNSIKNPVISPIFKDFKNGKLKIISFYAKKARGVMSKFLIERDAKVYDDIIAFSEDGYLYSESETKENNSPVFVR
jgi:cytoplasmic iron level regulating protein YaaA (DUF328/UPF0246 family)|tara:strand:+ start:869 stop:1630 length:762 start_codon:yes stop_codon:yes gene_type:complete